MIYAFMQKPGGIIALLDEAWYVLYYNNSKDFSHLNGYQMYLFSSTVNMFMHISCLFIASY